jgi:hypothetical protein
MDAPLPVLANRYRPARQSYAAIRKRMVALSWWATRWGLQSLFNFSEAAVTPRPLAE